MFIFENGGGGEHENQPEAQSHQALVESCLPGHTWTLTMLSELGEFVVLFPFSGSSRVQVPESLLSFTSEHFLFCLFGFNQNPSQTQVEVFP